MDTAPPEPTLEPRPVPYTGAGGTRVLAGVLAVVALLFALWFAADGRVASPPTPTPCPTVVSGWPGSPWSSHWYSPRPGC